MIQSLKEIEFKMRIFGFADIIVFLICINNVRGLFSENTWLEPLGKYLLEDSKVFQTVIILDGNSSKEEVTTNNIVNFIAKKVPTKVIQFETVTLSKAIEIVRAKNILRLKASTLFIMIQAVEYNLFLMQSSRMVKVLKQLSERKTRPKILAIILSREKSPSYKELLQRMWSDDALDFTVLDVLKKPTTFMNQWSDNWQISTKVHQFNPFTKTYITKKFLRKTELFPNKVQDLKGFQMKVASFNNPPNNFVKRNNSGYPILVSGPDAEITNTLSKVMNFRISQVSSKAETPGHLDTNINKTTGFLGQVANKKLHFFTNLGFILNEVQDMYEHSRVFYEVCYVALVPVIKIKTLSVEFSQNCWSMAILVLLLIALPVIVSHLLKFEKNFWSPVYIFVAALGFAIPREPTRSPERIVFIVSLFAFFISSAAIYGVLTNFELKTELELEINTLQDLYNLKLPLMMTPLASDIMRLTDNDEISQTLLRTTILTNLPTTCTRLLVKHRNVSCIVNAFQVPILIEGIKNLKLRSLVKIGKPCLRKSLLCLVIQPGSPYLQRINQVLGRVVDSGLFQKWYEFDSIKKIQNRGMEEKHQQTHILISLLIILATGYVISIITFIWELLRKPKLKQV